MKPLQQIIHSHLRQEPAFRLIGRPFCAADMIDLAKKAKPTDQWFSIDYSAATDNLSWRYSSRILEYVTQDLSAFWRDLAYQTLGPHRLFYPQGKGIVEKGLMASGQLMGSILSFPFLCLANLGVYLLNTAVSQSGWTDRERLDHVLVNGDDMIYAADPSLWPGHISLAGAVGLKMSVGKAYCHPVYANVNSTSVHFDLRKANMMVPRSSYCPVDPFEVAIGIPMSWKVPMKHKIWVNSEQPYRIDYLNTGLFYGQHKVQGKSDAGPDVENTENLAESGVETFALAQAHMSQQPSDPLCVNLNVVLQGSLPGRQTDLLKQYLKENSVGLRRECAVLIKDRGRVALQTRNMFLPECLGGMGVVPPPGWRNHIKPIHRWIAASRIVEGLCLAGARPLPNWELEEFEAMKAVPWMKPETETRLLPTYTGVSDRWTRKGGGMKGYKSKSVRLIHLYSSGCIPYVPRDCPRSTKILEW